MVIRNEGKNARGERIKWNGKLLTDKQVDRLKRTGYPYVQSKNHYDIAQHQLYGDGYFIYQVQKPRIQRVKGWKNWGNYERNGLPAGTRLISNSYPMRYDKVEDKWSKTTFKYKGTLIQYIEQAIETQNNLSISDPGVRYEIRRADGSCLVNAITTSINMAYINLLNNCVVKNST